MKRAVFAVAQADGDIDWAAQADSTVAAVIETSHSAPQSVTKVLIPMCQADPVKHQAGQDKPLSHLRVMSSVLIATRGNDSPAKLPVVLPYPPGLADSSPVRLASEIDTGHGTAASGEATGGVQHGWTNEESPHRATAGAA